MSAPHHGTSNPARKGFGLVLLIAVIITAVFGIRHFRVWNAEEGRKAPAVSTLSRPGTEPPIAVNVRKPLTAPARSGDWSEWISVPSGYRFWSCEANADLSCKDAQSDIARIGYAYQCKDSKGIPHDWTADACRNLIAVRVRSKSETVLDIAFWLAPY